jgi:Fe-S-cluster containining protein
VWVSREEIRQIAEFRHENVREFSSRFVRRVHDRYSLVEKPGGDCIFWDKQAGCTVYPARPVQCRTWPFWPENVKSPDAWEHVCQVCPGSGHGRVYSVEEILAEVAKVEK